MSCAIAQAQRNVIYNETKKSNFYSSESACNFCRDGET